MAIKRRFKNDRDKAAATEVKTVTETFTYREEIGSKKIEKTLRIKTYGQALLWHEIVVPTDKSLTAQKRDKFHARSSLELRLKAAGSFSYAIAWAEAATGGKARPKGARGVVTCPLCGTWYSKAAVYKVNGKMIGTSGTDCLIDILRSLNLSNIDAVAKTIKEEEKRVDKFRKIMAKVNDFKADFEGLYEHREWLKSYDNPYSRIWWEITNQLGCSSDQGIDEKWLESCEDGSRDRVNRSGYRRDESARRIPSWLTEASDLTHANGGKLSQEKLREELYEMSYNEKPGSNFRKRRPSAQPTQTAPNLGATGVGGRHRQPVAAPVQKPQTVTPPVPAKPDQDLIDKAKDLKAGSYGWSDVVQKAAKGATLTKRQEEFIREAHKGQTVKLAV